jgi:hypothetical protein
MLGETHLCEQQGTAFTDTEPFLLFIVIVLGCPCQKYEEMETNVHMLLVIFWQCVGIDIFLAADTENLYSAWNCEVVKNDCFIVTGAEIIIFLWRSF